MAGSNLDRGLASLAVRAKWVRGLLIAYLALGLVALVLQGLLVTNNGPMQTVQIGTDGVAQAMPLLFVLAGAVTLLSFAILIGSIIAISLWVYRAHANLRLAGLDGLNYRPGWAVGSFFIPIVGLIVPFWAMRELYNRSNGEEAHFAAVGVGDVSSWWSCYVAGNLVQTFVIFTTVIGPMTGVHVVNPPMMDMALAVLANLLILGSALFLFRIVGTITALQRSTTGIEEAFA